MQLTDPIKHCWILGQNAFNLGLRCNRVKADPEAGPTLNKSKAIAVDFPSKQPELAVLTTMNWA